MRKLLTILLAAALGLSSGALAACGNRNGLIPRPEAERLKASVDRVAAAANSGDCARATTALLQAQNRAEDLPDSVDPKLRDAINDGLSRLVENVQAKCRTTTTTTQKTQTETVPTVTATTPTETTPPPTDTTPTQTEPTTPEDPTVGPGDTGGTEPEQRRGGRRGGED